jgi:hypothetical protein
MTPGMEQQELMDDPHSGAADSGRQTDEGIGPPTEHRRGDPAGGRIAAEQEVIPVAKDGSLPIPTSPQRTPHPHVTAKGCS